MFLNRLRSATLIALLIGTLNTPLLAQTNSNTPAQQAQTTTSKTSDFLEQVNANFDKWDLDHNGELSHSEIDKATTDPTISGKSAAALVALKRAIGSKTYTVMALTKASIAQYVAAAQENKKAQPNFDALYKTAYTKISHITHDLFASGTPKLEMLHQGRMGDCFALAPLGAMIHRDPQEVVRMFEPKPDGTVRVSFGNTAPILLTPLTDAEIALSASAKDDGVWVNLYEKAVGEQRLETQSASKSASAKSGSKTTDTAKTDSTKTDTAKTEEETPTALDAIAHGGSAGRVIGLITGHRVKNISCKPWRDPLAVSDAVPADTKPTDGKPTDIKPADGKTTDVKPTDGKTVETKPVDGKTNTDTKAVPGTDSATADKAAASKADAGKEAKLANLRTQLIAAMKEKRLVCAGTPTGVKVPGISSKHAYAILDYDADKDTVLVWNPHGNTFHPKGTPGLEYGYPTTTGLFTAPLKEVIAFFSGISFETDQTAKPTTATQITSK